MQRPITPLHAIPSPAEEHAAAELASLPVEMLSRSTCTVFGMQAAWLCAGWQQTIRAASQAAADMSSALRAAPAPAGRRRLH